MAIGDRSEHLAVPAPQYAGVSSHGRVAKVLLRVSIALIGVVAALGFHWAQLAASHDEQLRNSEEKVRLRAAQLAHALALQVGTLVADIDHLISTVAEIGLVEGDAALRLAARKVEDALPDGALVQVLVIDADARLRFSSLTPPDERTPLIDTSDRSYFQAHGADRPA